MKIKSYLYSQLSLSFLPIFLGLYFITSIIFLVKIASLTSVITIDGFELFKLYSYTIPKIIFFTVPISFFISLVITLAKLSSEYELIVITSFGLNPMKILKIFFPTTLVLSLALVVISVGLIPKTDYLMDTFLAKKKKEANFNIKASEFGQKFGDWLIYIDKKDGKKYENIKLFKTEKGLDQFILANEAVLNNKDGELSFRLINGKAFYIADDELNQIDYKTMDINDSIVNKKGFIFTDAINYWKYNLTRGSDIDDFTFFILTSLFPLISLFLVIAFGYYNPRYEKNRSIGLSLVAVVIYYVITKYLTKNVDLHSLYIAPTLWIIGTYYLYTKTTKKLY
ncbi:permease [Malaciobacter halophilus]|uniref:Permease n=1 Tax=Malaciobacter halophilus TaxID=197482 RepID=A0A2N1J237_9BACT|nr:LptF/LptG family permease [Malaciobacter halophilus]AXH10859.1 lipooligosaccharide transport system, ABC transporter permease component LptF [Malaciobacter halophilus]PKI80542.1 permease [Malaciobacter halophilus]